MLLLLLHFKDKLRSRQIVHEQQMRDVSTRQIPLSSHLNTCCKNEPTFSIFPFFFYKFHSDNASAMLSKERYFIYIFDPKLNINYWRQQFTISFLTSMCT